MSAVNERSAEGNEGGAPDGVEIQLQDVSYCGGGGLLGNMCG